MDEDNNMNVGLDKNPTCDHIQYNIHKYIPRLTQSRKASLTPNNTWIKTRDKDWIMHDTWIDTTEKNKARQHRDRQSHLDEIYRERQVGHIEKETGMACDRQTRDRHETPTWITSITYRHRTSKCI